MKKILALALVLLFSSCSSSKKTMLGSQREAIESNVKDDKIHGAPLPKWTERSGIENSHVFMVGSASMPGEKPQIMVEKAAYLDAEIKLISDAPSDFRVLTQTAMNSSLSQSVQFTEVQTKLRQVKGLRGIKYYQDKKTCRKVVRYGTFATVVDKQCWVLVSVPLEQLSKAYERTIKLLFGDSEAHSFAKRMNNEIKDIKGKK